MGTEIRVTLLMNSSDFGTIMRLSDDGVIRKCSFVPVEEKLPDAREFAKDLRSPSKTNGTRTSFTKKSGLRVIDILIAIMQTKPNEAWHVSNLGVVLAADYPPYKPNSASPGLSTLVANGYVERGEGGQYLLTKAGRDHPQAEMLPFKNPRWDR